MVSRSHTGVARRSPLAALALVVALAPALFAPALTGCEDNADKDASAKEEPDAGANRAMMDKNIEKAVKSVANAPTAAATALDGPPPSGVFAPGQADKAHAPGAVAKLDMVDKGAAPRIKLRPSLAGKHSFTITVGKRIQRNLFPTIDYAVTAQLAAPAEGEGGAAPAAAGDQQLVVTVNSAKPGEQQAGVQVGEELTKQIATLDGTTITFSVAPSGALGNETIKLPEGAETGLTSFVSALVEAISMATPPWPEEPVGKGAYWVSSDRTVVSGVPVVRYRVTRIEKVSGDEIAYALEIRQYAADPSSMPAGVPAGFSLGAFQAVGQGSLTRKAGALWPSSAQLKSPIGMQLASAQQPQAQAQLQLETQAIFAVPKKEDGKDKDGKPGKGAPQGKSAQPAPQQAPQRP